MTMQTQTSVFDPRRSVTLDPYGPNPIEEDMKGSPAYAPAKASGVPVPKMFQGGNADLPVFTASGIDPQLLMKLPYRMRHAVAAEPVAATVHGMFERHANDPDALFPHEGLDEAVRRMRNWVMTAGIDPQKDAHDAAAQAADAKRLTDLQTLPPERLAAIHAQIGQAQR